jgi:hypothetical protein
MRQRFNSFMHPDIVAREAEIKLAARTESLNKREKRIAETEEGLFKAPWEALGLGDYNPDKIGIDTYDKMINYDSQVRKGLDILEMGVLYVPWEIKHPDPAIVEFLTWSLKRLRHPTFTEALREIMSAIGYGFSVTESIWEYAPEKKKWTLRQNLGLKTLDPLKITFYTDSKGHLLKIGQKIGGSDNDLPLDRTIVFSYNKKFGNWYGESLLRACYKNWFIKDNMLKFANIAFERFGAPIMLGVAKDLSSQSQVLDTLEHLYARSVAVLTKRGEDDPSDIRVLESKRASMPFMDYINYHDRMILERMLIGETLLKGGGGVYGPKMPYEILNHRLDEIRRGISGALSDVLDMLVDLNFDTDEPAELVFGLPPIQAIEDKVQKAIEPQITYEGLMQEGLRNVA